MIVIVHAQKFMYQSDTVELSTVDTLGTETKLIIIQRFPLFRGYE